MRTPGSRPFRPRTLLLTAALIGAAVLFFLARPPRQLPTSPAPPAAANLVRGAYHIHTTRSDGALDRDGVARAAAAAGLQFAIFTDHGDGTELPPAPEYRYGVLCVDGVEISTNGGHYVALQMRQAPYPLGGEAEAVAEDVQRLGGFGIAAHPFSSRQELAWSAWDVPVEGLEWLNADSEWRDESRWALVSAFAGYLMRPAGALAGLFDRPESALARWDAMTGERRTLGVAAHDAHGGLGEEEGGARGRRLHVPTYEAVFRAFSLEVTLDAPPTGDPLTDARLLLDAFREGAITTVLDALASPAGVAFTARSAMRSVRAGGALADGEASFDLRASVPEGARTVLLRNGQPVAEAAAGTLQYSSAIPGAYRAEIRLREAPGTPPVPWVVTNPIYLGLREDTREPIPIDVPGPPVQGLAWRVEHSDGSAGSLQIDGTAQRLQFRLAPAPARSPFVALVTDLPSSLGSFTGIRFMAQADRPMRVSAQLRFAGRGGARWRRSFYVDAQSREVRLPLTALRPADSSGATPPSSEASSLLFVLDTTNAAPGAAGEFTIADLGLQR